RSPRPIVYSGLSEVRWSWSIATSLSTRPRRLSPRSALWMRPAGPLRPIALALAAEPKLIVADEPTTALDVSIQAQIIQLLKRVCRERGAAVMLITHDMGVIAETCDRVAVMYAGRIAEIGPVHEVINQPAHPYSMGLMAAIPDITIERERLEQI